MSNLIEVQSVNKTYKRGEETLVVLDDLSLEVQKGDFLALLGPSGSGKSTLLNLIGGLDTPTSGQIVVNEQHLETMNASALSTWRADNVGFIFQFYNLLPVLTAHKNVEIPLLLTGLSGSQRKEHVSTALNVVGLSDRGGHKPNELSGGQQQRVAIARALVSDPDILVCDEPTGDLDRNTATEILDLLQILNRDHGKTILMVTHDPVAADSAKRTLHLDKGKHKSFLIPVATRPYKKRENNRRKIVVGDNEDSDSDATPQIPTGETVRASPPKKSSPAKSKGISP